MLLISTPMERKGVTVQREKLSCSAVLKEGPDNPRGRSEAGKSLQNRPKLG